MDLLSAHGLEVSQDITELYSAPLSVLISSALVKAWLSRFYVHSTCALPLHARQLTALHCLITLKPAW